jgi:signal transduction histidine kinase
VDNSLTAEQAGSGLGLSIARRILRDLGGDLIFEPEKDGGSRFIARIGKS